MAPVDALPAGPFACSPLESPVLPPLLPMPTLDRFPARPSTPSATRRLAQTSASHFPGKERAALLEACHQLLSRKPRSLARKSSLPVVPLRRLVLQEALQVCGEQGAALVEPLVDPAPEAVPPADEPRRPAAPGRRPGSLSRALQARADARATLPVHPHHAVVPA